LYKIWPFQLCCRGIKSICPSAGGVSLFTAIAHYLLKRLWKDESGADPNISRASLIRNAELSWDGYYTAIAYPDTIKRLPHLISIL